MNIWMYNMNLQKRREWMGWLRKLFVIHIYGKEPDVVFSMRYRFLRLLCSTAPFSACLSLGFPQRLRRDPAFLWSWKWHIFPFLGLNNFGGGVPHRVLKYGGFPCLKVFSIIFIAGLCVCVCVSWMFIQDWGEPSLDYAFASTAHGVPCLGPYNWPSPLWSHDWAAFPRLPC